MKGTSLAWYPILVALVGCGGDAPLSQAPEAAPEAGLVSVDADTLSERMEPDGKPLVVNLWATWCGPCIAELPEIASLARDRDDVDVLLVSMDYPTLADSHVVPFLEKHGLQDMDVVLLDEADPAVAASRVVPGWPGALPYTVVFDAEGNRVASFSVAVTRADLDEALR